MNCEEFWSGMPELPGAATADEGHAAKCSDCAARLAGHRAIAAGLRALGGDWSRIGAPDRLESRLVFAFRAQNGLRRPAAAHSWLPILTWATAAAALLLIAVSLFRVDQPPASPRRSAPRIELAAVEPASDWENPADTTGQENGFIALPNAAGLAPGEDVNLVRVEVPRSAMIALGFAVSADRASEPVEAEVMLGADGIARAVRFLDEFSNN